MWTKNDDRNQNIVMNEAFDERVSGPNEILSVLLVTFLQKVPNKI